MAQRLVALGCHDEQIVYVPNGFDRERFSAEVTPYVIDRLREHLALPEAQVLLYVGSMSLSSHPVDLLLEAFSLIINEEDTWDLPVLLLVGGGEDLRYLRKTARRLGITDRVFFTGRVAPEDVPLYYRLADLSVDPVRDDKIACARFPLKLVESWACGTPVITGSIGERCRILKCGGKLVKPGDARSLANGIIALLCDVDQLASMRDCAATLRNMYTWDHLVLFWLRVYDIEACG
jgi:glycosyltransferase involved in cell wall biosynthesis